MASYPCFSQDCPHCGSKQFIRVFYLGRLVPCRRCDREFVAADNSVRQVALPAEQDRSLKRSQKSPWAGEAE